MADERLIRGTLWATAAFNMGGSLVFAFPASPLGELFGFPAAPPIYRFLLALLIFGYGCAYAWLARQETISRPFVAFAALNKLGVFAVVFILWLLREAPFANVVALGGDLVFSLLFVLWLSRGGPRTSPP